MPTPPLPLPPQPTLRTARLSLAPLIPVDADDVFAYARDPQVLRHVNAPTPGCIEDTRAWVDAASREPTAYHWAVRLAGEAAEGGAADHSVVGVFEFDALSSDLGAVHYALAPHCWGRGLATEALAAAANAIRAALAGEAA